MRRRSNRALEDAVQIIIALAFFIGLSTVIGGWLTTRYKLLPSHSPLSLGIGVAALLIVGLCLIFLVYAFSRLSEWRSSWASCPHGVAGGKARKLCEKCFRELLATDEFYRRERELRESQQRLDDAASALQDQECSRLALSLVPNLEELRRLTWQKFEDEIADMFERFGYTVEQTPYINDHGRDAILTKDGHKFLLECKKYSEAGLSGRPDLQKFHSAIVFDRASCGLFVTTGAFTKDAIEFAAKVKIELIDGSKLIRYLFDSKPAASDDDKYRSVCRKCGDVVQHRLRVPQTVVCRNGHEVVATLDIEKVLTTSGAAPTCKNCGKPMRIVHWKKRKFWGCTGFPNCRHTRSWRRAYIRR